MAFNRLVFVIVTVTLLLLQANQVSSDRCQNVVCGSAFEACVDTGQNAVCSCKSGFYRSSTKGRCETDCDMYYCYYGAKCERGPNGRICRCANGYSGTRCGEKKGISIPIAVGSSIAAFVLVVFMAVIFTKNGQSNSRAKSRWAEVDEANRIKQEECSEERRSISSAKQTSDVKDEDTNRYEEVFIQVEHEKKNSVSAKSFTNEVAEESVKEEEQEAEEDSAL